jgi:hypothetical protein
MYRSFRKSVVVELALNVEHDVHGFNRKGSHNVNAAVIRANAFSGESKS